MIYINPTKIQGLTTLQMIQISNESPESLAKKKNEPRSQRSFAMVKS